MVEKITVHITPFGLDRQVQLYLPEGWQTAGERYPVLYMYDGHNLFFDSDATYGKSWGLKEFLDGWNKKIIVVGVECNQEGDNRLGEYSPFAKAQWPSVYYDGRGDIYMKWLVEELKPFIDSRYPTLPGRENTAIAGSSLGGLMSVWSLLKYNEVFSRAAGLSNSFPCCWEPMKPMVENARILPGTRLFMSWGSRENAPEVVEMMGACTLETNRILTEKGAKVYPYMQVEGRHCEADWEKQLPVFMDWLFED